MTRELEGNEGEFERRTRELERESERRTKELRGELEVSLLCPCLMAVDVFI